jgi:hypothetical protein
MPTFRFGFLEKRSILIEEVRVVPERFNIRMSNSWRENCGLVGLNSLSLMIRNIDIGSFTSGATNTNSNTSHIGFTFLQYSQIWDFYRAPILKINNRIAGHLDVTRT